MNKLHTILKKQKISSFQMDEITVFNTHCCGEIGDVVIGIQDLNFKSPKEASLKLFKDKKWRNFFLNEPRGGVFKHCNIIKIGIF